MDEREETIDESCCLKFDQMNAPNHELAKEIVDVSTWLSLDPWVHEYLDDPEFEIFHVEHQQEI